MLASEMASPFGVSVVVSPVVSGPKTSISDKRTFVVVPATLSFTFNFIFPIICDSPGFISFAPLESLENFVSILAKNPFWLPCFTSTIYHGFLFVSSCLPLYNIE